VLLEVVEKLRHFRLVGRVPSADALTRYRDFGANLGTHMRRIIRRAGLKVWPRTFQYLRASRETELAASDPLHVVCEWIGNSARVASSHYLQVRDSDFIAAARGDAPDDAKGNAASSRLNPPRGRHRGEKPGFHGALSASVGCCRS